MQNSRDFRCIMQESHTELDVQDDVEYEDEEFKVGPYKFKVTTIAFMPIEVLMMMGEKKVEISGQKLWCGSLGVIEYLLDNPSFVAGNTVLELGAGTGVLGMLCKKLNAHKVYLTDNDPRSLRHMSQDLHKNNIDAEVVPLDWFNTTSVESLGLPNLSEFTSDGGSNAPLRVVAGDVLYKGPLLEPFMATVHLLLTSFARSEMLLCHIPRAGIEQSAIVDLG
jgi:hypothetical protein